MDQERRRFIKTAVLGIVGTGAGISIISCKNDKKISTEKQIYPDGIEIKEGFLVLEKEIQKNIEPLAEMLVPGAATINITELFMEKTARNHGDAGFFDAGLWNLNAISNLQYKAPFYMLDSNDKRKLVLELLIKTNRTFFDRFRKEMITIYYSHPGSWDKLSYSGPPQPNGYLDYYNPPKQL